jgi:hypothetical protein
MSHIQAMFYYTCLFTFSSSQLDTTSITGFSNHKHCFDICVLVLVHISAPSPPPVRTLQVEAFFSPNISFH